MNDRVQFLYAQLQEWCDQNGYPSEHYLRDDNSIDPHDIIGDIDYEIASIQPASEADADAIINMILDRRWLREFSDKLYAAEQEQP